MTRPITPLVAVDIIIEMQDWYPFAFGQLRLDGSSTEPTLAKGIVLIERKNEPHGWALPGGMVDCGETTMATAIREAKEETGLDITQIEMLGLYDDPNRDPRGHTIGIVYTAKAIGDPKAADAAKVAVIVDPTQLGVYCEQLCFDHTKMITDYLVNRK